MFSPTRMRTLPCAVVQRSLLALLSEPGRALPLIPEPLAALRSERVL